MKHIICIGFKNSGKSAVGRMLADALHRPFLDLDEIACSRYARATGLVLSPREIMRKEGEAFFRDLEREVLVEIARSDAPAVIALGGGTPMDPRNREVIRRHTVVFVSAPKGILYERIMVNGRPAFFPEGVEPFKAFTEVFSARDPVFRSLADVTVDNASSVADSVKRIVELLPQEHQPAHHT